MKENLDQFVNSVNLNADTDFPYLVLDVVNDRSYPRNPGFQVLHWHEDLQFIYVLDGIIEVKTLDDMATINAGNGLFINKNIIHYIGHKGNTHYHSFLFPDYFLKFYFDSPAKEFVESVVEREQIPFYIFSKGISWCNTVLEILQKLSYLENNKTEFYVYEVLVLISSLWLELRKNILLPTEKHENVINNRMQKFLSYIEKHYAEDISLEDLIKSANVSRSECLRCFKLTMQTSPYKYLMEFRLSKAATMLKNTNNTISYIAESVGFHQVSHFGKCFREKTGYSPREYRKLFENDT